MRPETTAFIVTCAGPPLDYTTRVNLERAEIVVLDDGDLGLTRRRFRADRTLRLLVDASIEEDPIARVREVLAARPYCDFRIGEREREPVLA